MTDSVSNPRRIGVITGASSGIGYELASQFAKAGFDLIIAAEDDGINRSAEDLRMLGVQVTPVQCDLATSDGVHRLCDVIDRAGNALEAVALNAGVGVNGKFVETDLAEEINLIELNIISTVHLAKHIAKFMVARGKGGKILITSSVAAEAPGPYMAIYNASKAFIQSFALAIREEFKEYGISVTALQPDATDTNFFERAGMMDTQIGQAKKDDPAEVAEQGFKAMMDGDAFIHAGSFKNRAKNAANDLMPETVKAKKYGKMAKPGSAADA